MSDKGEYVFNGPDLSDWLRRREEKVRREIDRLNSHRLTSTTLGKLVEGFVNEFAVEEIVLWRHLKSLGKHGNTQIEMCQDATSGTEVEGEHNYVRAMFVEFVVPFQGPSFLLQAKPSIFRRTLPHARVVGQELRFRYERPDRNRDAMEADFKRDLQSVDYHLKSSAAQIQRFNENLKTLVRRQLDSRKEELLKENEWVNALDFPTKSRSKTYAAPVERKSLPSQKLSVATQPFEPEPVLAMEHYEHILRVISDMVLVMERTPRSFSLLSEEALRNHILVQLNGHYRGKATGETFNMGGKTDILIRDKGKNIFIAECKFWKGPEGFKRTIDQLLRYTAWRDTKTAIIVFNRKKRLSKILEQIPDLVKKHKCFKRQVAGYKHETGFRFFLCQRGDKRRELTLTVMVFNVPSRPHFAKQPKREGSLCDKKPTRSTALARIVHRVS